MDNLRLYMVTWNVATRPPEEDLTKVLGFGGNTSPERLADFYVIGLQEVRSQPQNIVMDALWSDPWTIAYREVLAPRDYVKVKTIRLQGLVLSLYCLRKHLLHLRDIETQYTKTGFGGMWGNKGAVSIRLSIYGCSVCFVNSHLTPHDQFLQERITDYNTIITSQQFQAKQTKNILYHDYVFWIGDLNFRLAGENGFSAEEIDGLVKKKQLKRLLEKDQLRQAMEAGEAFSELVEQAPTFAPTYKYQFHTCNYDLKRRPAWTDRILHKVNANVYENVTLQAIQKSYQSMDDYVQSDHKPVTATFIIKVFSDYHERTITFQPVEMWHIDEENSATYSQSGDVTPQPWDWIGIFKDNFSSLDDYDCYVYSRLSVGLNNKRITFPDTALRTPGLYRLIYFSQGSASVLGMSDSFQVRRRDNGTVTQYAEYVVGS